MLKPYNDNESRGASTTARCGLWIVDCVSNPDNVPLVTTGSCYALATASNTYAFGTTREDEWEVPKMLDMVVVGNEEVDGL